MKYICLVIVLVGTLPAIPQEVDTELAGTQLFPCAMTRYSTPIKVSGVLGVSFNRPTGHGSYRGFFAQIEPGFGGGKVNLGYRFGRLQFMPIWSIGLSASALQTWGNPLDDVEPDQTYLGLETTGALSMLALNFGVFRRVAGDDEKHDWIYTVGAGVGI